MIKALHACNLPETLSLRWWVRPTALLGYLLRFFLDSYRYIIDLENYPDSQSCRHCHDSIINDDGVERCYLGHLIDYSNIPDCLPPDSIVPTGPLGMCLCLHHSDDHMEFDFHRGPCDVGDCSCAEFRDYPDFESKFIVPDEVGVVV